ncbi:hypothetical protein [Streptomyces phaeofaciens]|uniref:hypothetical protein n=1 Tax=Streptomyces phaeofaciens TaxID=68254 RepID=UPI001676D830|nr:hypothetical protein [Streptomyces phaeofaciens]
MSRILPVLHPGARHWLPRLLAPVTRSTRADRWCASRLTPLGFPVDLSVATSTPWTTRYATEFVSPEQAPADRLAVGLDRLRSLGIPSPDEGLTALLLRAHRQHTVMWGAWLSGRHDDAGDRFKLYVEVPKGAAIPVEREITALLGILPFPLPEGRLRLVGLDTASRRAERYYQVGRLTMSDIRGIAPLHLRARANTLHAALGDLLGRSLGEELYGVNANITLTPGALTICGPAVSWLGPDHVARDRLVAFAARSGLDLGQYAALTSGCTAHQHGHHGIVSLTLGPDPDICLSIVFSPFAVNSP